MQDELTTAIATDLGIQDLSPKEQQDLIGQFGEVALKAATLAVVSKLAGEKQAEFMTIASAGDPEALQTFLNQEVPGHEEIAKAAVAEEVKKFKEFRTGGADAGNAA